ncbi:MAG: adenylate/guanylate cyclase domain-containing protein, partial [Kiloniellales bacterium]
ESVFVAGAWIPTDRHGQVWVRYARRDPSRFVSAKDVLAGTLAAGAVANKLVLVGTSAAGLHDLRATPLGEVVPGVEIHMQLLETILTQSHLVRPNYTVTVELAVILMAGLLLVILVPTHGAYWTMGLNIAVTGALGGASWYLFSQQGVLLDAAYPAVATFAVYGLLSFTNYAREEAQRRQIRTAFAHYLSPEMVDRLARDPDMLKLGGENREMTLLFCDVHGFTSISEKYDAESLTRLINRLLTPLTDTILKAHGTIDKYMGDCIMAFWNAPMENKEHALDACRAALSMIRRLVDLNAELEKEAAEQGQDFSPLKVGIGLNTGVCCVGNMGSEQRFDYSVIGDHVNLTSRLEGQTRTYRVPIVIGEATRQQAGDMAALEIDLIRVKGKAVPARIFALLGDEELAASPRFAALSQAHEAMLTAYRAQDWRSAREALEASREYSDGLEIGGLLNMYEERIDSYEADPPGQDWDGVYLATTK